VGFPDDKELKRVRQKFKNIEPTRTLPKTAAQSEKLKFELCRRLVVYLGEQGVDPARMSEIVKYKIELFTVDRLLGYLEELNPDISVIVA